MAQNLITQETAETILMNFAKYNGVISIMFYYCGACGVFLNKTNRNRISDH